MPIIHAKSASKVLLPSVMMMYTRPQRCLNIDTASQEKKNEQKGMKVQYPNAREMPWARKIRNRKRDGTQHVSRLYILEPAADGLLSG